MEVPENQWLARQESLKKPKKYKIKCFFWGADPPFFFQNA
jgi:hypothetical protein